MVARMGQSMLNLISGLTRRQKSSVFLALDLFLFQSDPLSHPGEIDDTHHSASFRR